MRKEHNPTVADPVVEVDFTFRCLGFEVWGSVANLQRHGKPPSLGLSGFCQYIAALMYGWNCLNTSPNRQNDSIPAKNYSFKAPECLERIG
jgi:hypothetical protein